ncbi:hypothetical protein HYR69_02880 [Candidatus Sumerlaeota bacterium]|nr:hypothetical protein [Candidatus Sumerlaeota bacterium]
MNSVQTRLIKEAWGYDSLNRKDAAADITMTIPDDPAFTSIDLTYESATISRLTREKTVGTASSWDVTYTFDSAQNRKSYKPSTTTYNLGYGTGNRETSASPGTTEGYDFKGNVTSRVPLVAGGNAHTYTWDAWDRMKTVTRTSPVINLTYNYDSSGRMLERTDASGATPAYKLYYYSGLSRILEESALKKVHRATVIARDVLLDDFILSTGKLDKAYQLIPGSATGGYVGAQSGAGGGIGQAAWSVWYYHREL